MRLQHKSGCSSDKTDSIYSIIWITANPLQHSATINITNSLRITELDWADARLIMLCPVMESTIFWIPVVFCLSAITRTLPIQKNLLLALIQFILIYLKFSEDISDLNNLNSLPIQSV